MPLIEDVRQACGLEKDNSEFDDELLQGVVSAFGILNQLGVGPDTVPNVVTAADMEWTDFTAKPNLVAVVQNYVCHKVREQFDPPTIGFLQEALTERIREMSWRLEVEAAKEE